MYFLIHCNEDGEISVDGYGEEDLLKALADEDYGPLTFFDKMPNDSPEYWKKSLIIEGDIVVPKAIKVVKAYEI